MKRSLLNRYSLKKVAELTAEVPIREQLCLRAGGQPRKHMQVVRVFREIHTITRVICHNGICELCHERKPILKPHEKVFRSHGGKLSLENSVMCDDECHAKAQNNLPKWSKG